MTERSEAQRAAIDRINADQDIRAKTSFDHQCADCPETFHATRQEARTLGWTKKWRRKDGGGKTQVDICPFCKGSRRARR